MQVVYLAIISLSSLCFVLTGCVGYLFWLQRKTSTQLMNLAHAIQSLLVNSPEPEQVELPSIQETPEEDTDRLSVNEEDNESVSVEEEETEEVESEEVDEATAGYNTKTVAEIKQLLTQKGIPYGKRDPKAVLFELLKSASA